jgi:anti-anti-sigma factor
MQFEIGVEERGDAVHLLIRGELDLATAPEFERRLAEVEATDAPAIVVHLDQVAFLDSTGLRALIAADARSRANGSRLRLTRGSPQVERLLQLVGADTRLPFVDATLPTQQRRFKDVLDPSLELAAEEDPAETAE